MTGAGSHLLESDAGRFDVEARSVNNRFLKTSVRHHGGMPNPEALVEGRLRKRLGRGHVSVTVRYRPPASEALTQQIDPEAFRTTATHLATLAREAGLAPPTAGDVLSVLGELRLGRRAWDGAVQGTALLAAVEGAIDDLVASREAEGARLAEELLRVLASIQAQVEAAATRAAAIPETFLDRLKGRLAELLGEGAGGAAVDPAWLAREVALLADRADVTEEVARLRAHAAQFQTLLDEGGVVGRRLDFLVQELHREANTLGSKANDIALTRIVMELKTDIERLREQVQNLE